LIAAVVNESKKQIELTVRVFDLWKELSFFPAFRTVLYLSGAKRLNSLALANHKHH
jgi:hypothetical protein